MWPESVRKAARLAIGLLLRRGAQTSSRMRMQPRRRGQVAHGARQGPRVLGQRGFRRSILRRDRQLCAKNAGKSGERSRV